jgi:Tol biopolymer transport system component
MIKIKSVILFLLFFSCSISVFSQEATFGKNKVQYRNFNWYFIQSKHFDVYFVGGSEYIADYTADVAEKSYLSISKSFRYELTNRVSIIVYNSHNDFQQTNVIDEYMEEGIGGVTELFKNRVVLPFEGDYKKFKHVIHHELVHAVMNDMFYGGSIQNIITNNITLQLPLWFSEGLAEYEALKWDTNSDMFIRDATIHQNLPPIEYLNGYYAYRGGQAVWNYIATKYGERKVGDILNHVRGMRSVEQGFRSAIGLGIDELNERWQKEMKAIYWPDISKLKEPKEYAQQLTDHKKDGSFYNTSPTLSPRGDKIAFISNRDDYFDVYLMNAIDGKIEKKLIKGQRTPDFEELHLLTPGMAWSPDGKKIALATKSGDQDAVIIFNTENDEEEKLLFNLDGIFSIDWSPTGDKIAFVGNTPSQSDIYVYDFYTKQLTNATDDHFSDYDPVWSKDGKTIYFASDRKDYIDRSTFPNPLKMQNYDTNERGLYKLDILTQSITKIVRFPGSEMSSPFITTNGKSLLFVSDRNGISNVYALNLETDSVKALTNSLSGVFQISVSRDANKLAFNSLNDGGFDIFLMNMPLEKDLKNLEPTNFIKQKSEKTDSSLTDVILQDTIKISDDIIIKSGVEDSTHLYGNEVSVDYRNYVFTLTKDKEKQYSKKDSTGLADNTQYTDSSGNYKINKYKLNFSPDIVYGNAGFNTYYGIQGSTVFAFSDMLGNHRIYFITNLMGELKNSDFTLAYLYLPNRIDYGFQVFHSARFINQYLFDGYVSLFRYRTYGGTLSASYPLNKFERFDLGLTWLTTTRENLDIPMFPIERRQLILPSFSFIQDNSLWGIISPANGTRYNLTVYGSPKIAKNSVSFYSVEIDYRNYFKLSQNYTIASRAAFGGSYGKNPQRFVIGGVGNWINVKYTNDQIPIENAEDFLFLTAGIPLRGYIYNTKIGTKYFLLNNEIRFPFLGYLAAGSLPVIWQSLTGILFLDLGSAWYSKESFQAFAKNSEGKTYMKDLLGGTGTGVRIILLGFLVRFDVGWSFNLQGFSRPQYYISLGTDY